MPWLGIPASAPSEFRIFRAGVNDSDYGPIMFDEAAATTVMTANAEKGNPLFFDWNHGMAVPKEVRTREQGASAGRFKLAVRDGELWAVECEWNEAGAASIARREYELFSPFFAWNADADGVIRPTQVLNCALVNMAGLDHLVPIAAEAKQNGDATMNEAEIRALQERANKAEAELVALRGKNGVMALAAVVGVSDEAEVKTAVTALVKVRTDLLALTAKTDIPSALGVIDGWKSSHLEVVGLKARDQERETIALEGEFTALLDKAVKEHRVYPAELVAFKEDRLAPYGGKVTKECVARLSAHLPTITPRAKSPGAGPREAEGADPATAGELTLSAADVAFLAPYGITEDTAKKAIANTNRYRAHRREMYGSSPGKDA